jgi:hypothetical protein
MFRERAVGVAGDGDERNIETFRVMDEVAQLNILAGVREHEHDVLSVIMPISPWLASPGWM